MSKPVYLTSAAIEELKKEKKELVDVDIPAIAEKINKAKELGDLKENFEYHEAKQHMAMTHSRVQAIEYQLLHAQIYEAGSGGDTVGLGSTIEVDKSGSVRTFQVVGAHEANPSEGKISNESPLGAAFLERKVGDQVEVETPRGVSVYVIKSIV